MSTRRTYGLILPALILLAAGCASVGPGEGTTRPGASERGFTVLSVNDVYRIEGVDGGTQGSLARLRSLRRDLEAQGEDLLLLHAGDFLSPSLPSRVYRGEQMVDVMNFLDGDPEAFDPRMLVTFGNHEFDRARLQHAAELDQRLAESQFRWLGTDLVWTRGDDGKPLVDDENLVRTVEMELGGLRVGIFSLTLDSQHPAYVERFEDPVATAREQSRDLRGRGADVVIALTHLTADDDAALLAELGDEGPDVIFGGHEHNAISRWVWYRGVQGRWVLKADAEARTAVVARISVDPAGQVRVTHERRPLSGGNPPPDPEVAARVEAWLSRFDRDFCTGRALPPGCLAEVLGHTRVRLAAEELEIRRFETNLGNWAADRLLESLASQGAQIAFVNSGSLRLNQDLPPGDITLGHVEGLFAFPAGGRLLQIDGATLQKVADRAVEDWTGGGHWLQIAGFAFRHDPGAGTATDLTLLTPEGPRPVDPEEPILAVTMDYLVNPEIGDQDGYTMLLPSSVIAEGEDLKDLVKAGLAAAEPQGIAPEIEGRICNPRRPGPCLAVDP